MEVVMETKYEFYDLERSLKDYEFTAKAFQRMNSVVYSADFEDMDSDTIFIYLYKQFDHISFKDHLKRYIYKHAEIKEEFRDVPEDVYKEILLYSFEENGAPFSFEPTTKRKNAIIKSWLSQDYVRRSTVFLLGFGLKMSQEDVSEFLTKVILEEDFNMLDPEEAVYRFCFKNGLRYAEALSLLKQYEGFDENEEIMPQDMNEINEMIKKYQFEIMSIAEMRTYLKMLKKLYIYNDRQNTSYLEFMSLIGRVKRIIADIYNEDNEGINERQKTKDSISYGDIERMICSGIPLTKSGNLQKMSVSALAKRFRYRRMSRQRLDDVTTRKIRVDRFDIITLLFFIYSQEQQELEPEIRLKNYMNETNAILDKCSMMRLYPVNPYEAFVMMCLLSECPLETYSDTLELSYKAGE